MFQSFSIFYCSCRCASQSYEVFATNKGLFSGVKNHLSVWAKSRDGRAIAPAVSMLKKALKRNNILCFVEGIAAKKEHVDKEEEHYYQLIAAQLEGDSFTRNEESQIETITPVEGRRSRRSRKGTRYSD